MKVLFLAPYPPTVAPSQRFRFEQYLEFLDEQGIKYDYKPFISNQTWGILHQPKLFLKKALGIISAFWNRILILREIKSYDWVFIHREASHIGPPIFEWVITKLYKKKVVYDFDDAIWLPNYSRHNAAFHRLKFYGKVKSIMKWSNKITAGNEYLGDFAQEFNPNVILLPTTIDTLHHHNRTKNQDTEKIVIGWTGTLTTSRYLDKIAPVIQTLEEKYAFEFVVISNEPPQLSLSSLQFISWKKETEIEDLLRFNIGVMPLEDDKWAQGKCGFKALQYMALGIPPVVSPVGVNTKIVENGVNGFLCSSEKDWYKSLERLILDAELRKMLGKEAQKTINQYYSVEANKEKFLNLFE